MSESKEAIYNCILDFKNWEEWDIWNEEKNLIPRISNPSNVVGARYRWKSTIREVKDGLIILNNTTPPHSLEYEFYYGNSRRGIIFFHIHDESDGSFVTCSITINNKNKIFGRYFAMMIKSSIVENIEDVLLKIDAAPKH